MATAAAGIGASVISTILEPMVDRATAEAMDQCYISVNIKIEVSNLRNILGAIESALPEAEEKKVGDSSIQEWLRDLDDICYDARDMLDEFVTVSASIKAKRASKRVKLNSSSSLSLLRYFSICRSPSTVPVLLPLRLRCRLAYNIRNLRKRLEGMKKDMETANLLRFTVAGDYRNENINQRPKFGSFPDKQRNLFLGREDQKEKIMKKLLDDNDNGVHVVPIRGMGGVGKTTLAQSIFNHEKLNEQDYPIKNRWWLCVGEKPFDAKEIILKIIKEPDTEDVPDYQSKLKEKLKGEKFLIVLDDVWKVVSSEWKSFWNPLTHVVGKGGTIIITTRMADVITATGTSIPEDLTPLGYDDCLQIFESHAFANGNSGSDLEWKKEIGRKIVEKLGGLPLAAEVVGRSLLNERDQQTWRKFLEYHQDGDIMSALRWSYNCLPSHLKKCFAYCSLFPKDHTFDEQVLARMWTAHGFTQIVGRGVERSGSKDTGAEYFKQLVNASLFQYVDGRYMMHDMIHDLAVQVSNGEIVSTNVSMLDRDKMERARHLYVTYGSGDDTPFEQIINLCNSKKLLTVHLNGMRLSPLAADIQDIFKQLKRVRVLVLNFYSITFIPDCVSELIHLRYLDFKSTLVKRVPESLCDLYNLQTLIPPDWCFVDLPRNIVNLVNLRTLRAHLSTCKGVKNMRFLQDLDSINVCKGDNISELGSLLQLRGNLRIKGLENVTSVQNAEKAMMQKKTYVDHLELIFTTPTNLGDRDVQTEVLEALRCPPNLTFLQIEGYNGLTAPSWIVGESLVANLQSLKLLGCRQLKLLPPLGQFKSLKHLEFRKLNAIEKLDEDFYGKVFFPSLETLTVASMEKLKEWDVITVKDNTGDVFFPCLKTLEIIGCSNLVMALPPVQICTPNLNAANYCMSSLMSSLTSLKISGCEGIAILELHVLVSLKHLVISDCCNLTRVKSSANVVDTIETLSIENCRSLLRIMDIECLFSLTSLKIFGCEGIVVLELDVLVSLKRLVISDCCNLTHVTSTVNVVATIETLDVLSCRRLERLTESECLFSVKKLKVFDCSNLVSCPRLVAIEDLDISFCGKLRLLSISVQGIGSLRRLEVFGCPLLELSVFEDGPTPSSSSSTTLSSLPSSKLEFLWIENMQVFSKLFEHDLVCLRQMWIRRISKVKCFNKETRDNWHNLTSLEDLEISKCDDLESLPPDIHRLSSLKELCLYDCPKLQALPEGGLPLSVEKLKIAGCPLLYQRCKDVSGVDWQKIEHIPHKKILDMPSFYMSGELQGPPRGPGQMYGV